MLVVEATFAHLAVVVKTNGIPFWGLGEFTTHFGAYFSGWIESDVHWGLLGWFSLGSNRFGFSPMAISLVVFFFFLF